MHSYEVEVKSLLGSAERAQEVREALKTADPTCKVLSTNKQLNHYFVGSDLNELAKTAAKHLPPDAANQLTIPQAKTESHGWNLRNK
jgi:hypothetical protein